jgi:ATP-binding cassette subfamily F protein uup
MGLLIGLHSISKAYGTQTLFKEISFTLSDGDRIGLIGPNGSGKTTLMNILAGIDVPDAGYLSRKQGVRVGYASQMPEFPSLPIEELLIANAPKGTDPIESQTRARTLLSKAQFTDFTLDASTLSGGWKKRLDIVRALMQEPDLLILDEPTNHLDLEGIVWLERFLAREKLTYLVVSHDRYFLEKVSNKIIELNKCYPQGLFISEGGMGDFMQHRDAFLNAQAQQERSLAAIVRDEVDWLRRSPKARTTKSQSRVEKAYELLDELDEIKARNKVKTLNIEFSASERETRKLLVAKNLTIALGGRQLFKNVDILLSQGTRLGIVGKNGTGKTTLLKLLSGAIKPDMGTVKYADDLRIVYFDQHREHIPPHTTLKDALSPTSDTVNYRGQPIHVNGWAKKFLFTPDKMLLPVGCLSGGERARIHIARLMLEPADVLFLDEPTNDLDIQTLEVIEESLKEFSGAVVLITHDRCLMDRVCTQILGLGIDSEPEYFADYQQWEDAQVQAASKKPVEKATPTSVKISPPAKKLTYNEQRELDGMEQKIQTVEEEIASLHKQLEAPDVHADAKKSLELYNKLGELQTMLESLYDRWHILLEKSSKK